MLRQWVNRCRQNKLLDEQHVIAHEIFAKVIEREREPGGSILPDFKDELEEVYQRSEVLHARKARLYRAPLSHHHYDDPPLTGKI